LNGHRRLASIDLAGDGLMLLICMFHYMHTFPRKSLSLAAFVLAFCAVSERPSHAAVLGTFQITEYGNSVYAVGTEPAYFFTTAWAGIYLNGTQILVHGFPVSSLPSTYTATLLPGNANFNAINTALHQANAASNDSVTTEAQIYATGSPSSYWTGQSDPASLLLPSGHTSLAGYTLTEIDATLSNMSVSTYTLFGTTHDIFQVTETVTLQGYFGTPEPGTLALLLGGAPLLLGLAVRKGRKVSTPTGADFTAKG
jgi:hypothetical protein